ncbi:transcriptional regulator, TetR family [Rhizobiales bacterium GAS191]|nr:transcriptional regulator, TetR family [Rhizobiales bacterium GAS113]SEC29679.1 transcriptional regulator, TetR family [Rhizobiales bacterium GAS188]SEC96465.1 transcriptional regulator, TetR family [Rhizobiales bacterium GAS191]
MIFLPRGQLAKRLSILEAAAAVFRRDGFTGASIEVIAAEAGVSRQTVYNHHGDKETLFIDVVKDMTEHANAELFSTLATFPDRPKDLRVELIGFAMRLARNCLCNREAMALRKIIEAEGERYPELLTAWQEHGPGKLSAALAARLANLAHSGFLDIGNANLAARQFMALVYADLQFGAVPGRPPAEAEIGRAATEAVGTFLKAYGHAGARMGSRPDEAALPATA